MQAEGSDPQQQITSFKPRVLVIGGAFSGSFVARELKKHFDVTIVDAKDYFEFTPGILRCFVKPSHYERLSFTLEPVFVKSMGVKFIHGEVMGIDGDKKCATIKRIFQTREGNTVNCRFDYAVICAGCNFGPFHKWGQSLWFPTIHEAARPEGDWPHIDERYYTGRKQHILEEHEKIKGLATKESTTLVVGAGFIGVEWVTELQYYFPKLKLSIIDFLPRCLGPLPDSAAEYCQKYMEKKGIKTYYGLKYAPQDPEFLAKIDLPNGPDCTYVCIGVKASNYFMPAETLSDVGPGGGGWIIINKHLQVMANKGQDNKIWAGGKVFACGDCNLGCVGSPPDFKDGIPPIPKISYPGEEQAMHACKYIEIMAQKEFDVKVNSCLPKKLFDSWWPWGAGMFATSLGPHDACFVMGANGKAGSGKMVNWSWLAAIQKEIIEVTKTWECKNNFIGLAIWHFVHHTPVHLWGRGPLFLTERADQRLMSYCLKLTSSSLRSVKRTIENVDLFQSGKKRKLETGAANL